MQNNAYANKTSFGVLEGGCFDLSLFASSFFFINYPAFPNEKLFWNEKKRRMKMSKKTSKSLNHVLHFPVAVVFFNRKQRIEAGIFQEVLTAFFGVGGGEKTIFPSNTLHIPWLSSPYIPNLHGSLCNGIGFDMGALHLQQRSEHCKHLVPGDPPSQGGNNQVPRRS